MSFSKSFDVYNLFVWFLHSGGCMARLPRNRVCDAPPWTVLLSLNSYVTLNVLAG